MRGNALPPQLVQQAHDVVRRRTGLIFTASRRAALEHGIVQSMDRAQLEPELYLSRLETEPSLLDDLVGEITVGETYFFREPQQLAVIRDRVIPTWQTRAHAPRIWSAGCASGEEPYTLAILTREAALLGAHILGTDLSRGALAAAKRAVYSRWSLRGVAESVVTTYFESARGRFALRPPIRAAVEFRYLNLAEDEYPSLTAGIWGMDLILCRNVLIYFDGPAVARVAQRLIHALSHDGWLFLGAADPPLADLVPCHVEVTSAGLAYRRRGRVSPSAPPQPATAWVPSVVPSPPAPAAPAIPLEPVAPPLSVSVAAVMAAYGARHYDEAADSAGRLVTQDGGNPGAWIILVRALANRGDLDAAGRACAAALDRHCDSAELAYLHGVLLAEGSRHAEAADAARRALYLERSMIVAHMSLATALARLGDAAGARRALVNAQRELARLGPHDIVAASDGEPANRLAEMARVQLELLDEAAA